MRKLIIVIFLSLFFVEGNTQLNNSWIDYNKTYFKFKVADNKLFRISKATLDAAGLGNINADHFQLWRNGVEERLFTTQKGTAIAADGYIEFVGKKNDFEPDRKLFQPGAKSIAEFVNLFTDSSTYFLTVNTSGNNLRWINQTNNAPSQTAPVPYFIRENLSFRPAVFNAGNGQYLGQYLFSSAYDDGEGFATSSALVTNGTSFNMGRMVIAENAPANAASVEYSVAGSSLYNRTVAFGAAGNFFDSVRLNTLQTSHRKLENFPLNVLRDNYVFNFRATYENSNDRFKVGYLKINYPSPFNFGALKFFEFDLATGQANNYLVISGFNLAQAPILLDNNTGARYVGEIASTARTAKFQLTNSDKHRFYYLSTDAADVGDVSNLTSRKFVNFSEQNNQGDFLIISHPDLYKDNSGKNVVEEYRVFRSSADGGAYNAVTYNILELEDQFGFGISGHPSSVQDFIFFADEKFSLQPKNVLIIGRGVEYNAMRANSAKPEFKKLFFVPTFGEPASDILLAAKPGQSTPVIPIGRISAINGEEVKIYLEKLKQYIGHQKQASPLIKDKLWMKNFMHVVGGATPAENSTFTAMMQQYEKIAEDTLIGANVETFIKSTSGTVQQGYSERISQLFSEGVSFMGYFGHASATVLEFNLTDLSMFEFNQKYPLVNISGCDAGQNYSYTTGRLNGGNTITDTYVLTPNKGSIGLLSSTHFGIPSYLHAYNIRLYNEFARLNYGGTIGEHMKNTTLKLDGENTSLPFFTKIHNEQITLHGDPAVRINYAEKPDYAIEDQYVQIDPVNVTTADNDFRVKLLIFNLGKAISDSFTVSVKRKVGNSTPITVFTQKIPAVLYKDSVQFNLPVNIADRGSNELIVSLDDNNEIDELYETNNVVTKTFFVSENVVRPVFPYNFAIVKSAPDILYASSSNFSATSQKYLLQLDTTLLFNSPLLKSLQQTGPGGLVEFGLNGISINPNMVYYWRVAAATANDTIWNSASFIYIPGEHEGFNQSHYYQFKENRYDSLLLGDDRKFSFDLAEGNLKYLVNRNFGVLHNSLSQIGGSGVSSNTIQFNLLDVNGNVIQNNYSNGTTGLYGSNHIINSHQLYINQFEFNIGTPQERQKVLDFIKLMPDQTTFAAYPHRISTLLSDWKNDREIYGTNNLYDYLASLGIYNLDSMNAPNEPFLFVFRKDRSIAPVSLIGEVNEELSGDLKIEYYLAKGKFITNAIGPAKSWETFIWDGKQPGASNLSFNIIGVKPGGQEVILRTVDSTKKEVNISDINASEYPFLKVQWITSNNKNAIPFNLEKIQLYYVPLPEGAVFISSNNSVKDSVLSGEKVSVHVGFKNISNHSFEKPMKINFQLTDRENVVNRFEISNPKILHPSDTIRIDSEIDVEKFGGQNFVFIDFNPENDQPEQYHFNNIYTKSFSVNADAFAPLLDVTFDGVHILNKDIVSSRPNILINLTDENKSIALKDTSLITIQLRTPDNELKTLHFGNDMQFIPADLSSGLNKANIEYNPTLTTDGEYELIISAKDASGNKAGKVAYRVAFTVMNKPMISNLLNYPNPFTTSTAFVFTLTGSEVPQNLRIQILTVTGKVVREITKAELGPIHIGRNITDFKWDGTDMYGQPLANGVYLYRFITNLNGKKMDKLNLPGDNTDKYFDKGYGKMYLMR